MYTYVTLIKIYQSKIYIYNSVRTFIKKKTHRHNHTRKKHIYNQYNTWKDTRINLKKREKERKIHILQIVTQLSI